MIVVQNEIFTQEKLGEYGEQGLIKNMHKGVTQEERDKLAEKFGDRIGDREFIIKIDLLSEKEKTEKQTGKSEKLNNALSILRAISQVLLISSDELLNLKRDEDLNQKLLMIS